MIDVAVRDAVPGDLRLVYSSWLRSYKFHVSAPGHGSEPRKCPACQRVPRLPISGGMENAEMRREDYFDLQGKRIDRLLSGGRAGIVVVHPVVAPSVICAWACLDLRRPDVFHYVYTANAHRNRGYARMLVKGRTVCTHMTDSHRPDSFRAWKIRAGFRYQPQLLELLG